MAMCSVGTQRIAVCLILISVTIFATELSVPDEVVPEVSLDTEGKALHSHQPAFFQTQGTPETGLVAELAETTATTAAEKGQTVQAYLASFSEKESKAAHQSSELDSK